MQMLDARQQGEQGFAGGNDFNQPRFNAPQQGGGYQNNNQGGGYYQNNGGYGGKVVSVMVAIAHKVVVSLLKRHNNQHLHQLI